MKIALVYPPCSELNLKSYPLGLGYLLSSLRRQHEVDVYNYNGKKYRKSINAFLKSIKRNKYDLVGISFTSFNRWAAYQILRKIKKIDKNIIVTLGGIHPSVLYGQFFRYFSNQIDFVIQSEGEKSFYELCNALDKGASYKNISGLVYKNENGGFTANRVTDLVWDLDQLAMPDFSYAEREIKAKQLAFLITSKGCPVNCSFCATSSFWGQKLRMNSPERVGAEVEYVKSLGAKRLFFHDDTFNLGIERTLKIASILKRMNVEYVVQCRVTPVNEEMVAKLVESGCKHISWGVESLSDKIMSKINKKITKPEVKKAFDICAKHTDKLTTSAYCCVGVPGETEDTVRETVDYMNNHIKSTHGPAASILYILPGTKLYDDFVKQGKFQEKVWITSNSVYYYTQESNIRTLNRWRKKINRSGIRLPYSFKYFWDTIPEGKEKQESIIQRKYNKISKKLKRNINLLRNRY